MKKEDLKNFSDMLTSIAGSLTGLALALAIDCIDLQKSMSDKVSDNSEKVSKKEGK